MVSSFMLTECQGAYEHLFNRGVITCQFPTNVDDSTTIEINLAKLRTVYGYVLWYDTEAMVVILNTQDPMLTPYEPYILCFDNHIPVTLLPSIILQPFEFDNGSRDFRQKK